MQSDDAIKQALKRCADEPVHSPGAIQPIGALLGCDLQSGAVCYASANAEGIFDCDVANLFTSSLKDLLGREIWHSFMNLKSQRKFGTKRLFAGIWKNRDTDYAIHVSRGGEYFVVELESSSEIPALSADALREHDFLVGEIQTTDSENDLFNLTCQFMRHVTGFDRVMIYQFDEQWNGTVRAEAKKPSIDSFIGLSFPHWDIPAQAREIMARLPLRLIADIDHESIPILTKHASQPPLDISQTQSRVGSQIHYQYLRNMGCVSTMTLSVVIDKRLWGMISFHHQRPRVLPSAIRHMLVSGVLPIFCLKLGLLKNHETVALSHRFDTLQSDIQVGLEEGQDLPRLLALYGPMICEALDVAGVVIGSGTQNYSYGTVPVEAVLRNLIDRLEASNEGILSVNCLNDLLDMGQSTLNGIAGVLAIIKPANRSILVFREEIMTNISWAGNPDKTIANVDGQLRLQPRGSFSRFMEESAGKCKQWTQQDKHLINQLWPLLSVAERQALMADISRQQELMINELNHRVRNILALVKSVTQSTRRESGSIESYSQALESRIMALASAHDIGSGAAKTAVSIREIISLESKPFNSSEKYSITGEDGYIKADIAPIFALVVHELTTNAVKHGALSTTTGHVDVDIRPSNHGIAIAWKERGGPPIKAPDSFGFGTTLIKQAVPYEMHGKSDIQFCADGLQATIWLPDKIMDHVSTISDSAELLRFVNQPRLAKDFARGLAMILEDNFMIANDMKLELESLGFSEIELCSSDTDALDILESFTPQLAILDVNLGKGKTSYAVATKLKERGIPFAFVTGYGESMATPRELSGVTILSKPVSNSQLSQCVTKLLGIRTLKA
ncbi:MAG: HWE histidine kinase domain-containing protein [Granulosicoccus sp.]